MKNFVCILLMAALAAVAAAADVTGKWSGSFYPEGGDTATAYLVLKQTGSDITGTAGPNADQQWPIQMGKIADAKVTLSVADPDGGVYKCVLVLAGDSMKGDVEFTGQGETRKGKIDLSRVK